jgi:hypothetical protein
MEFELAYLRPSVVQLLRAMALIVLSPNLRREPVFLEAGLTDPLLFRDALLTLHDVVVSDFDCRLTRAQLLRLLDPLITVASDGVFFEAFSQDESCYARVTLHPELLTDLEAFQSGTTNVDFSPALVEALASIRPRTDTRLKVEREGFSVAADDKQVKVKKVKVPDSWLRGFLNVQAAMTLPLKVLEMSRTDLRNLLAFLQSHKERQGPRALVLRLRPNKPAEAVFEPWNLTVTLTQSVYHGDEEREIRLWGRRRLFLLRRLLPKIQKVFVGLIDSGYPSFWLCDLGFASFTLGISGWTVRPFASSALHLLKPRKQVSPELLTQVAELLRYRQKVTTQEICQRLSLDKGTALTALGFLCERGKAMFDLEANAYRWREVTEMPIEELRVDADPQREVDALRLVQQGRVKITDERLSGGHRLIAGTVRGDTGTYAVTLTLDAEGGIVDGECECTWFRFNHLRGGPCKHLLALRLVAQGE